MYQVVRCKADRAELIGSACEVCEKFYKVRLQIHCAVPLPICCFFFQQRCNKRNAIVIPNMTRNVFNECQASGTGNLLTCDCSRHRASFVLKPSPQGLWSLGFDDTQ